MRKGIFKSILLFAACFLLGACVRNLFDERDLVKMPLSDEGQLVDYVIKFGSPQGARVSVSTKGGLGTMRESNVFNLYLLIFEGNNNDSKRLYGHFFNNSNLDETSLSNYWTVDNMSSDSDTPTSGTLHIKTTAKAGCTIVAVANLNPNDLDVSSGLLSTIKTYGALKEIVATQVHSEVTANSGYFMMTGKVDNVDITSSSHDYSSVPAKALVLKRLYAKVTFNVQINPGSNITSFIPDKWQIVNVPSCCYLMERSKNDYPTSFDAADSEVEFFPTEAEAFDPAVLTNDLLADEKTKIPSHGFTFYMMENRYAPSANPSGAWTYADREKQVAGTGSNRAFAYANPFSTYVVLTGKLVMKTTTSETTNATLDATVKYKIHLGNFNLSNEGAYDNFQTLRNHNYVYTVYINGAEDIKVEADGGAENEPGATGSVVVANETVFTSDCHYSTQVISFHADYLDPEHISWYVETPFNPEGIGPNDVENDLSRVDYKWVEFRLNEKENGVYTDKRVLYKPHDYAWPEGTPTKNRTMYVDEVVDYLLIQRGKYENSEPNDFDSDTGPDGPKITFTAFVNEYYYTVHPLSGEPDPSLWKDYAVNQPMRRMHILATSKKSADGESSLIGSSFTIQQRSIQSIYAVNEAADLQSAWGMEFTDDNNETGLKSYWRTKDFEDCGNTSPTNGRLNTLKLWGILDPEWPNGPHGTDAAATLYWADYMNLHGTNETAQLWDKDDPANPDKNVYDYNYLRYSCLTRNRDNNGNDIIDPEEIRWYMASDIQLIGVFMGAYGIEGDARLYQKTPAEQTGNTSDDWRQHVVASNRYINTASDRNNSNKYPRVIWAEEGITGSSINYNDNYATQTHKFSTRCIRNLGYYVDDNTSERVDITLADPSIEPQSYVTAIRKHLEDDGTVTSPYTGQYNDNVFYEFDCSRINVASLRSRVDHELVGHDENSRMACLPSVFVAAPLSQAINVSSYNSHSFNGTSYNLTTFKGLNDYLDASFGDMEKDFDVCPDGYRLPNVREIAIMWNIVTDYQGEGLGDSSFFGNANGNSAPCRTHWSKGPDGSNKVNNAWGWGMLSTKVLMAIPTDTHLIQKPRCVRDL